MKTIEGIRDRFQEQLHQTLSNAGVPNDLLSCWRVETWEDSKGRARYVVRVQFVQGVVNVSGTELESHMDLFLDGLHAFATWVVPYFLGGNGNGEVCHTVSGGSDAK